MSSLDPSVQAAVVTGLCGLAVAVVGGMVAIVTLLVQTRNHARRADVQVSNNHVDENGNPINLREESDERHAALVEAIGQVRGDVRGMRRDVGRIDTRTIQLRTDFTKLRDKVDRVEDTQQQETINELRAQLRQRKGTHDAHQTHES